MPFAYFAVLIFGWRLGNTWIRLTMKPVFLLLTLARIKAVTPKCVLVVFLSFTKVTKNKTKKPMPLFLKNVLDKAVKVSNFLNSWSLSTSSFITFCDEMVSSKKTLQLHTEVVWMSRGKAVMWLFELEAELKLLFPWNFIFFTWKNNRYTNYSYSDLDIWQIFSWK